MMKRVIVACVHNAGRSQMAAAVFNELADRSKAEAISAGTEPGLRVHPEVLAVMQEVGIDLSHAKPQKLTEELAGRVALLITMGCGDKCPYIPGARRDDWPLENPKDQPMEEVRAIRDDIRIRVTDLFQKEGVYWRRLGFGAIDRKAAPAGIQGSHEWSSACRTSATAMAIDL